jgi:hypothetical protein
MIKFSKRFYEILENFEIGGDFLMQIYFKETGGLQFYCSMLNVFIYFITCHKFLQSIKQL